MTCEAIRIEMQSLLDGDRDPSKCAYISEHLGHCEPCRQALHELARFNLVFADTAIESVRIEMRRRVQLGLECMKEARVPSIGSLQSFCETSWRGLADAPENERHRFAERFLSLLGWAVPDPFSSEELKVPIPTVSYLLRAGNTSLVAHFVSPRILEPPSIMVLRGLDYCEASRLLVNVTGAVGAQYAFLTDLQKACIYDVEKDELLLHADIPSDFVREFGTVLMREEVEAGSLHDICRQSRSFVARQLREWNHRWGEILTRQARLVEEKAQLALDRLLVLRYLLYHDILNPEEWNLKGRVADLLARALSSQPSGSGWELQQLFSGLWTDWRAELFAPDDAVDDVLQHDRVAVPLLREYALLSQNKFSLPTILDSFNYGNATEEALVRMIPEVRPVREAYLRCQSIATVHGMRLELDINEEGYRAISHWFDHMIEVYHRVNIEVNAKHSKVPSAGPNSLDFSPDDGGDFHVGHIVDKYRHTVENALVIYCGTPRQFRISRLLLYLHLINCYEESGQRFTGFPNFRRTFKPRPRMLDSDRQRICDPSPDLHEEWEVI